MADCELKQLSPHFYWFTPDGRTDRPSLGAVVGDKGTLILDAGASTNHAVAFLTELAKHEVPPPRLLALTHWHWDHIFGSSVYPVPIIAHRQTATEIAIQAAYEWTDEALDKRVEDGLEIDFCRVHIKLEMPDRSDLEFPQPDILFDDALTVDLGNVTCQIVHVGGDHAADSSVMFIPEDKMMFLSDCLGENLYHNPRCYTPQIFSLLDRVLAFDAETYIWGHSDEPESRAQIQELADLLRQAWAVVEKVGNNREAVLQAISASPSEDEIWAADAFLGGLSK